MRSLIIAVLLAGVGCSTCGTTSPYWRFECGKMPTVLTPALISPQNGQSVITPLAAYPSSPPGVATLPLPATQPPVLAEAPMPSVAVQRRLGLLAADPCSCDAILQRLDAVNRRLDALNAPKKMESHP